MSIFLLVPQFHETMRPEQSEAPNSQDSRNSASVQQTQALPRHCHPPPIHHRHHGRHLDHLYLLLLLPSQLMARANCGTQHRLASSVRRSESALERSSSCGSRSRSPSLLVCWAGGFSGSAFRIAPSVGRSLAAAHGATRLVCDASDLAGVRSDDADTKYGTDGVHGSTSRNETSEFC